MPQNLNQAGKQLVVDMINSKNGLSYAAADLTLGVPAVHSGDGVNTRVAVNPVATPGEEFAVNVYYNRLDLGILFADVLQIEEDGQAALADFLTDLNAVHGTALSADDLTMGAIPGGAYPRTVTFTAKAGSYGYFGMFTVDLTDPG